MSAPLRTAHTQDSVESLCLLIKRASGLVADLTRMALKSESGSITEMLVISRLDPERQVSMAELKAHLGHHLGSMTRVLDRLERAQLIRRERDRHDRRAVRIVITDRGGRQLESSLLLWANLQDKISAHLSWTEHETLVALLERLLQGLQRVARNRRIEG